MNAQRPVAVVTGASSGIGAIYADRLAARGYDLLLIARREDRLQSLAQRLQQQYAIDVSTLKADLSHDDGIREVEQRLRSDDRVALLVNNAGSARMGAFLSVDVDEHETIHTLNTTALMRLSYAALSRFSAQNNGTLINIASVLAFHAWSGSAVYSATKAWVVNFTRGLQDEFADSNVRIQAVLPAATATEIWDLSGVAPATLPEGSVMSAEDLVDAALTGLDNAEHVTLPPVHDLALWDDYEQARLALFATSRTGVPAPRYQKR